MSLTSSTTKHFVLLGLFTTIALVLSLFESTIGFVIPIPGAKVGFSNIILLSVLILFQLKDALFVASLKSLLLVLLVGQPSSFIYSFTAGISSTIIMYFALRIFKENISEIGVSVLGAVTHNIVQVQVARWVLKNTAVYYYRPYLILVGIVTGFIVGLVVKYFVKHFKKILRGGFFEY